MNRTEHKEDKWKFSFVEYSCEDKSKKLPLVVQLHGAGERGDGNDELNRVDIHGFSEYLIKAEHNCIVVMPQCPTDTFWVANVESIIEFIEQLKTEYNIDENRIYLTGLSMGGFGTWYTAMARPDIFAAIAPVCGGGMAWNAGVLKMPVWAFHGVCDTVVSVNQTDEMVSRLKELGADVAYTRIEGVGHNAWDYTYGKELMDWLLSKKKN